MLADVLLPVELELWLLLDVTLKVLFDRVPT